MINNSNIEVFVHLSASNKDVEALGVFVFADQKDEWLKYCTTNQGSGAKTMKQVTNHLKNR